MYKIEKKYYLKAFLIATIMGVVLLIPFVVIDGGYFIFYGDYNAQQIPFYKACINAVQNGSFGWNWQTDLGVNFIGTYSFYTLGSPFFWLAAMFPAGISQYLMAPLLALKLGLASLFAFIYIRRFVTKPQTALIGGLLYAFSGYSMYNIFFNHFHEAIVFFPLLLIGLEEAVVNKRRGLFVLTVALNAFVNYFFFIGECIFLVIYFVVRMIMDSGFRLGDGAPVLVRSAGGLRLGKGFRSTLFGFLCLAAESILGVMLAGILFVPSIYQVLDVPRSTSLLSGWNFLFYGSVQRYGLILESMFFPPEVAARTNMFTEANAKWSSVALYLPLFSMAGVIAFMKGAKGHWARALLGICLVMAFVPGLNASFVLFNSSFYTRWFYMPELICCLATVYTLEHGELDLKLGLRACAAVVAVMSLLVVLAPFKITQKMKTESGINEEVTDIVPHVFGDFKYAVFISIGLAVGFLVILRFVIMQRKKLRAEAFTRRLTAVTIICCMMLGYYFVGYGRILGPYIRDYNKTLSAEIRINDADFYRMEGIDEMNNVNMLWNMSSLKSFTSIIPSSTFDLYEMLDIERSVNSAPEEDRYALRALTRVKYIMIPEIKDEDSEKRLEKQEEREKLLEKMAIYEYADSMSGYDIYSTEYALPMGFAYDEYVAEEDRGSSGSVDKLMIRAVILTKEQVEKYSDILTPLDEEQIKVTTLERFKEDAGRRIEEGVSRFSVDSKGFSAVSDFEEDKLVMFSVPFDGGWSAEIDGAAAGIEKVNGGFMAVRVPAGYHEVVFTYRTPGFMMGVIFTIAGAVLIAAYIVYFRRFSRHKPRPYAHLYAQDQVEGVKAHDTYISQLTGQIRGCPEKTLPKQGEEEKELTWPEVEEDFMDTGRYDFSQLKPKKYTSHLTEDDEAFNVLKELEEKKDDELY